MKSAPPRAPKAGALTRHIALRLDPALIARIDALIPKLSTEWRTARRSDVLRKVILSGLPVLERTESPRPRTRARHDGGASRVRPKPRALARAATKAAKAKKR